MPQAQTAYNPKTGETLTLENGQWLPSAQKAGSAVPATSPLGKASGEQALALLGWEAPKTAYNPKTKEMLQLNPATGKWEPATAYAKIRADISQHPLSYANPVAALGGLAETTAQAFTGMAKQMNAMVAGAAEAVKKDAPPGTYHAAKAAYEKAWDTLYGAADKPETHWGWAINKAFAFVGEGLNKEQQFVQKQTGSEAAGDVASLFTGVLLMGVNEAGAKVKKVWDKTVDGRKPVQEGFDKFAAADPASAEQVVEKVSDAQLKKEMKARLASVTMTKDKLKAALDPMMYKQEPAKKAKPGDGLEVTQEHLDKMFSPDELQRAMKEHQVDTAYALKERLDAAKRQHDEQTAWLTQEAQKNNVAQTVAKSALPEGPWTELASGKELPPAKATAMSHAFDQALFGQMKMHQVLSPFTKEVWDDLSRKIFPAVSSDGTLLHPTQGGVVNFWKWATGGGRRPVVDKFNRPLTFYNAIRGVEEPAMMGKTVFASSDPLVSGTYVGDPRAYGRELKAEDYALGADYYTHAHMNKVFASFKNPLIVDANGKTYNQIQFRGKQATTDGIVKIAKAEGHDGVVFKGLVDDVGGEAKNRPSTVIAAIEPGTLKSALGNNGLWQHEISWMHSVIGPVDKDLIQKALSAAPGTGMGAQDAPTVKEALAGSEYTLKTLERLPNKPVLTKLQVEDQMNRSDVTEAEKGVLRSVLESYPGETIKAKDLVRGFQLATDGFKLNAKDTGQYADYGLSNIGIGGGSRKQASATSTIWQLPDKMAPGGNNHFTDPNYFAHTRNFESKGIPHVVEIQSDVAQHTRKMPPEEMQQTRAELKYTQDELLKFMQIGSNNLNKAQQLAAANLRLRQHELQIKLASGETGSELAPMLKHWYRRIIGETLARAAREGKKAVRFATADTVAKVEGWPSRTGRLLRGGGIETTSFPSEYQSIYDRYNTEIAGHLRKLGGTLYSDSAKNTWIEVPTKNFAEKRIDMFGTTMLYSMLSPFDPRTIKLVGDTLKKLPGYKIAEEKTRIVTKQALNTFYPEGLSDRAENAAAIVAKGMAIESHLKSIIQVNDKVQDAYWEGKPEDYRLQWLQDWEAGKIPKNQVEAKMLEQYKERMKQAYDSDVANGVKAYEPIDNYVYHVFKNGPAVEDFLTQKYGISWGDPRFTKERQFRYIKDAVDAGFELKTTKPSSIVEAREFASAVAAIRVHLLDELDKAGLAQKKVIGDKMPPGMIPRRSPSGQLYYLTPDVAQLLHNAFDTRSLWADPGIAGMAYRNWMQVKNHTVPVILSMSAFHPLHIGLGMDFASEMTRINQELAAGVTSAADSIPRAAKAIAIIPGQVERSYKGFRMLRVLSGEEKNPTPEETTSLNYMLRGGFIPFNTSEFNTSAIKQLRGAIKRNAYVTAGWKLPWAMLEAIGWPIYQKWIPALKTANYLDDVHSAIKSDPSLLQDDLKMNVRLNKIRKSVEDRFGQMSYNTLFWNRWARDIGQATTLSMGWKLGFLRQFAGQPFETAKAVGKLAEGESLKSLASKGELNKTMFVGYYVMMATGLSGLMTYMMTGTPPQGKDWILPRVGGKNPDGTDRRVNTMFYTREYASFYTHVKNEGLGEGLTQYAVNSAAPNFKIGNEFLTGLDYRNHEIYNPDDPEWKQLVQKTSTVLGDLDPISVETYKRTGDVKGTVLGAMGFSPAPKYMTESSTEGKIKRLAGYYNKHITPYEKAQYSDEVTKLHNAARTGDEQAYQTSLETLRSRYKLSSEDMAKLQKNIHVDPMIQMFKHLSSTQQVRLLKDMTPEEKQKYIRAAHNDAKRKLMEEGGLD